MKTNKCHTVLSIYIIIIIVFVVVIVNYYYFERGLITELPWVPETFLARFPVSVKSL